MAVEVVTGYNQSDRETVEKYDEGHSIAIDDGHLKVHAKKASATASVGKLIAVFAPGKWQFARYVKDAASTN